MQVVPAVITVISNADEVHMRAAIKEERHKRRGASVGRPTQQIQCTPRHQLGVVALRDVQALYDVDVIVS